MRAYGSSLLGTQNPDIKCLDLSGCNALIPESELRRFLPDEMMRLWERARQRKDIQSADLKGLEECPFCDYSVIIESAVEKLLRCGNKEVCGIVSCRACKKPVSTLRFLFCVVRNTTSSTCRIIYHCAVTVCFQLIYSISASPDANFSLQKRKKTGIWENDISLKKP
jgi:hypothetical protein